MDDRTKIIRTKQLEMIRRNTLISIVKAERAGTPINEMKDLYIKKRMVNLALYKLKEVTSNATS